MRAWSLRIGQESDTGPSRERNEDYVDYSVPDDEADRRSKGALFLVADGMGGHQAGDVASREAVQQVRQSYYGDTAHKPAESLVAAFRTANQVLYNLAQSDPAKAGMGTTLVAAIVREKQARMLIANVGDSRAYLHRRNRFNQVTADHSWVEAQVRAGLLTRAQAERHPQRNLITRALGIRPEVEVDLFEVKLRAGDQILLCTDGVSGELSDQEMAHIVGTHEPPAAAAELVAQANERGGSDNASALVVQLQTRTGTLSRPTLGAVRIWPRRHHALALFLVALLVLGLLWAAVASLRMVNLLLMDNPAAAPQPGPIRFERLAEANLSQIAFDLGYASANEMAAAHEGQLDLKESGGVDLWPARPGLFLVGPAENWECQAQMCTFALDMAGVPHRVGFDARFLRKVQGTAPASTVASSPLVPARTDAQDRGRAEPEARRVWQALADPEERVRVFGFQVRAGEVVDAQWIERANPWWAVWQPAWSVVYQAPDYDGQAPVWVYAIADRQPNSPIEVKAYPGLYRGDPVLAWGTWLAAAPRHSMAFEERDIYLLEENRYVPRPGAGALVPQPAAGSEPTTTGPGTPSND